MMMWHSLVGAQEVAINGFNAVLWWAFLGGAIMWYLLINPHMWEKFLCW